MIQVSSLGSLRSVAASLDRFDLLTMLSPGHDQTGHRGLARGDHLELTFHDIVEKRVGLIAPDRAMMEAIIGFARANGSRRPLLIHCWAGISRSSAAAFAIACDRNPGHEQAIAAEIRRRAAAATPNRLMVALADDYLGRRGRMIEAIESIGRGVDAFEGEPYQLPCTWPIAD